MYDLPILPAMQAMQAQQQALMPVPAATAPNAPTLPVEPQPQNSILDLLSNMTSGRDPNLTMALMRASASLLGPRQQGESNIGHIGRSINESLGTYQAGKDKDFQRTRVAQQDSRAERQLQEQEASGKDQRKTSAQTRKQNEDMFETKKQYYARMGRSQQGAEQQLATQLAGSLLKLGKAPNQDQAFVDALSFLHQVKQKPLSEAMLEFGKAFPKPNRADYALMGKNADAQYAQDLDEWSQLQSNFLGQRVSELSGAGQSDSTVAAPQQKPSDNAASSGQALGDNAFQLRYNQEISQNKPWTRAKYQHTVDAIAAQVPGWTPPPFDPWSPPLSHSIEAATTTGGYRAPPQ